MSFIYHLISTILLFWHSAWDRLLDAPHALATDWAWVLGIVFLVLTIRVVLFPLFLRQVRSQQAIQRLQPRFKELQAEHQGDRVTLQKELAELYRREKASPFGALLPMLVQIPIFIGLLHVLRHLNPAITDPGTRTLYGWSEAQFADASRAELFGAPIAAGFNSGIGTVHVVAGVLIVAMIVTTFLTSRMSILKTGWSENPQQRTVQRVMLYGIPLSLLVSGFIFPVGVIVYWTTQNLFALGQQIWLNRRYPATPPVEPAAPAVPAVRAATTAPQVGAKPNRGRRASR
ncbi:membrane protein insertase YidC [Actinoplanes sp. NPDC023801]|uniref:membrane protein insertase YidC n=1 Tax=Actinoplanes sp. NPDC023801 TaxID=3154595 RepID=UPI0033F6C7EF